MAAFDFGVKVDPKLFDRELGRAGVAKTQDSIRQGWEMFRQNTGEFVGFTLIIFAVLATSSMIDSGSTLLFSTVAGSLYAGYGIVAFKLSSGKPFQFNDFFRGFHYFLPLFLFVLASIIIISIGCALLLVPGIYLAVGYMFTPFLIIDYRMGFWQAMEISRTIITRHWVSFFGFALALFALNVLGGLAFGVGLLVTFPVTSCAVAIAYKEIVGLSSAEW